MKGKPDNYEIGNGEEKRNKEEEKVADMIVKERQ